MCPSAPLPLERLVIQKAFQEISGALPYYDLQSAAICALRNRVRAIFPILFLCNTWGL
jgi:hypothetical protein